MGARSEEVTEELEKVDKVSDDASDGENVGDEGSEKFSDTVVWETTAKPTDNVGEGSVEIDVETLIAEFETEASEGVDESGKIRRRLDAMRERKRRHDALEDFDDYDFE